MKKRRVPPEIYDDQQIKAIMDGEWQEWPSQGISRGWKTHRAEEQPLTIAFDPPLVESKTNSP